eukprot:TRINITY_DN105128_c2_g1_i1.p1 TRINITY_DN105128_c2_g1~~TRINITY_DN105128_c2_g1_i1.p1  ORF type:complete len:458 (+),score=55.53 TRINITY_DN105128_c2_g1_i1:4937-6310(+)
MKSKTRNKKLQAAQSAKKKPVSTIKPPWNDNLTDISRYQLSKVELLQRKVSCSSKNLLLAKERITQIHEQLKSGKLPETYKDAIRHKQKKIDPKEEYRQKAKAIVYPVRQARCETSCAAYRKNIVKEPQIEDPIEPTPVLQPMALAKRTACMAFTSANEPKIESMAPIIPRDEPEEHEECKQNEEEQENYLDCNENIKKLSKLQEELVSKDVEVNDCMASLNAALGINVSQKLESPIIRRSPEQTKEDTIFGLDREEKVGDNDFGSEADDSDLERISQLIAKTHKDIDDLTGVPETNKTSPIATPTLTQSNTENHDILKKYENSFMHSRRGMKASINVSNKENDTPNTGIISRKLTNKTDISLSAAIAPRQMIFDAEYYKTNIQLIPQFNIYCTQDVLFSQQVTAIFGIRTLILNQIQLSKSMQYKERVKEFGNFYILLTKHREAKGAIRSIHKEIP